MLKEKACCRQQEKTKESGGVVKPVTGGSHYRSHRGHSPLKICPMFRSLLDGIPPAIQGLKAFLLQLRLRRLAEAVVP